MPAEPTSPPDGSPPSRSAGECWGGLAAMLVALPSAIAYGIAVFSLLGPDYVSHGVTAGVIGAAALGVLAPLLGGAPRLISAPCAPAAAVLAALATQLLAAGQGSSAPAAPARVTILLMLVTVLAGALQLAFGTLGIGRLIKYIPYPVVSGYLSGVGVLIFASQVPKFLGLPAELASWAGVSSPVHWQPAALAIGTATIAGVLLAPLATKVVPAAIVGLMTGLATLGVCSWLDPTIARLEHNPLLIGPIALGGGELSAAIGTQWQALAGLRWADVGLVAMPALTLAVLLSVDTLKTCVVLDALTRTRHRSNRELIGQGCGNLVAGLLGGMPGAGTMGATLVNRESGGTTRWSGVFEGACVVAAVLVFGRWIAWVPVSALAGLLVVVAVRMFDWGNFALLRQRSTWLDFGVVAAVVVVAVKVNLIAAAGTGLGLAILLFIREQIHAGVIRRRLHGTQISSKQHRLPEERALLARHGAELTICELQGSLFFGTTDQLLTELEADLKQARCLILDLRRVRSVDFTGVHLLEQFEAMLRDHDGWLLCSRVPANLPSGQNLRAFFAGRESGAEARVRQFETLDDALQWAEDRILERAQPRRPEREAPLPLGEIELLRDLGRADALAALAACVGERSVSAGEKIVRCGETGDELFLIRRGSVRLALPLQGGSHHNLAYFGRGDFFGEMAFLDGGVRSADAIAATPTELFVLSRARFDAACRANPDAGALVFARLARALALRLRQADAEVRSLYEA